ncbi:hypothetical protein KAR91_59780 [Candidatus Pacearchaeota archaeon]|nr:hypothetical protein [Candidatus Pacearchaeota archaeon]
MRGNNTIEKLEAVKAEAAKQRAVVEAEIEDYKAMLERLCDTRDGAFFMRKMIRYCGIFAADESEVGKRKVFLELVYPYIKKSTLTKILEG